jgi:GntR family transcriptional regulator
VDRSEQLALHDQVAAEIRKAIANGEVKSGERLPPAVDLAAVLGVNRNTVLRALRLLRDEGTVDFTRGRGVHVIGTQERSTLVLKVSELVDFARGQGCRREELISMIRQPSSVGVKTIEISYAP